VGDSNSKNANLSVFLNSNLQIAKQNFIVNAGPELRRLKIMDGIQVGNVDMTSIWLGTIICPIFLEIKAKKANFL
jgi:hypothetical protein